MNPPLRLMSVDDLLALEKEFYRLEEMYFDSAKYFKAEAGLFNSYAEKAVEFGEKAVRVRREIDERLKLANLL